MSQRDYQSRMFALQRLRTQLDETETKKSRQAADLEQLNAKLNVLLIKCFSKLILIQFFMGRLSCVIVFTNELIHIVRSFKLALSY